MEKQAFIAAFIAKNTTGRFARGPVNLIDLKARAESAWEVSQDPHAQFVSKLAEKGKYWSSTDGSKSRVYFDFITIGNVQANGYYDIQARAWSCNPDALVAQFTAAVLAKI